jgi:hypothetical protein
MREAARFSGARTTTRHCSDASAPGFLVCSSISQKRALPGYASISGELLISIGASGHPSKIAWLPMMKTLSVLNSVASARTVQVVQGAEIRLHGSRLMAADRPYSTRATSR